MPLRDLENVFVLLFSGDDKEEFSAGIQLFILQNVNKIEIENIQYAANDKEYTALITYRTLVDISEIYYPIVEEETVEED